jgi:hypothetical protein
VPGEENGFWIVHPFPAEDQLQGFLRFFIFHWSRVARKPILNPKGFKEAGFPPCKTGYSAFCARIPVIGKNMPGNTLLRPVMTAGFLENAP